MQLSRKAIRQTALCLALLLLTACEYSLAEDVTPPPGSVLSLETPSSAPIDYSLGSVDVEKGAILFEDHCAACHGREGLGDGASAGDLPVPVPALADPELAQQRSPEEWYETISQGNLDRFMPPFSAILDEGERLDVLAFVFSLSQPNIDEVTDDAFSSAESLLDDEELVVSGVLTNESGGGLPAGSDIVLHAFDQVTEVYTQSAALDAEGRFEFEPRSNSEDLLYIVSVDHDGLTYFSEILSAQDADANGRLNFQVVVYDSGNDLSDLIVESLNLVVEFPTEDRIQVVHQILISNTGNYAVTPDEGGPALLRYSLPADAENLVFGEGTLGDRYQINEDGFADMRAVLPGENSYQLLYAFELPYEGEAYFQQNINLPTQEVLLFLPEGNVKLATESFTLLGEQILEGVNYQAYRLAGESSLGDFVEIRLTGRHPLSGGGFAGLLADQNLQIGLLALLGTLLFAWWWLNGRLASSATVSDSTALADEIIALDSKLEQGKMSASNHAKARNKLKKALRAALKNKSKND
jgi:mono/diheme cytochrome c family protein